MSTGQVVFVSGEMAIVRHDRGFCLIEMKGKNIAPGDNLLAANWRNVGDQKAYRGKEVLEFYCQGNWATFDAAATVARAAGWTKPR
jgi:hypothetical protein